MTASTSETFTGPPRYTTMRDSTRWLRGYRCYDTDLGPRRAKSLFADLPPVGPMMSSPFMGGSGIRAVVLDLDDTLVDHQASARRSSARPVLEQGKWTPPENIEEWKSASEGPMVRRRAGEFDRPYYRRGRVIYMRHVLG